MNDQAERANSPRWRTGKCEQCGGHLRKGVCVECGAEA